MFVTTAPENARGRLSDDSTEIIRATLPLIGENINAITPVFYKKMFTAHPELIADTFNRGNQKSGEQQKALAASIATFAAMLVDDNAPDPVDMLSRIGHKHVSLGITEDQYQIVHDNLFAAIVEVLGEDVVTAPVAAAWDEVYWLMAEVLVNFERDLYRSAGVEDGQVFTTAELVARRDLPGNAVEFTFRLAEMADQFAAAKPGQYVSIGVRLPDGARQLRQYSLISHPSTATFGIAVQRDGEVSSFLLDSLSVGEPVDATLPAGDLVLSEEPGPVVLVSQGIGSTPMVGMLQALAARVAEQADTAGDAVENTDTAGDAAENTDTAGDDTDAADPEVGHSAGDEVVVLHADSSEADHAQAALMTALTQRIGAHYVPVYRDQGTRVDLAELQRGGVLKKNAKWYLCGGNGFLQDVRAQLAEHPELEPAGVHFELFSPNDWLIS